MQNPKIEAAKHTARARIMFILLLGILFKTIIFISALYRPELRNSVATLYGIAAIILFIYYFSFPSPFTFGVVATHDDLKRFKANQLKRNEFIRKVNNNLISELNTQKFNTKDESARQANSRRISKLMTDNDKLLEKKRMLEAIPTDPESPLHIDRN